jgi:hypothetical protein
METRKLVLVGAFAAVAIYAQVAEAGFPGHFLSGNELYGYCTSAEGFGIGLCRGYVEGVIDHLEATRANANMPACLHTGITADQASDVVLKYLKRNPERRDEPAWSLVLGAVTDAWCP